MPRSREGSPINQLAFFFVNRNNLFMISPAELRPVASTPAGNNNRIEKTK